MMIITWQLALSMFALLESKWALRNGIYIVGNTTGGGWANFKIEVQRRILGQCRSRSFSCR